MDSFFIVVNKSYCVTLHRVIIHLALIYAQYKGEKYLHNWNEEYSIQKESLLYCKVPTALINHFDQDFRKKLDTYSKVKPVKRMTNKLL